MPFNGFAGALTFVSSYSVGFAGALQHLSSPGTVISSAGQGSLRKFPVTTGIRAFPISSGRQTPVF